MEQNSEQPKKDTYRGKRGGRYPRGKKRYQGGYKTNQNYYQNQPYNQNYSQQYQIKHLFYFYQNLFSILYHSGLLSFYLIID